MHFLARADPRSPGESSRVCSAAKAWPGWLVDVVAWWDWKKLCCFLVGIVKSFGG